MKLSRSNNNLASQPRPLIENWAGLQKPGLWFSVWFFIVSSSLVLLWTGYHWGERVGLFFGLLGAIFLNLLIFFFGDSNLIKYFGATPLLGQDPWGIGESLARLASALNMPIPSAYVFDSAASNAFTIGIPWKPSALGLSSSLLNKLHFEEREAVLAFLLAQIKHSESFIHGFATIVNNAISGLAGALDRMWPGNFFFGLKQRPFLVLLSPLVWVLIKLMRPSKSYLFIDAMASEILDNRQILAEVLWRLQGLAETCPLETPAFSGHHFIVNPESTRDHLFSERTHPPMKHRLEKLVGFYPI